MAESRCSISDSRSSRDTHRVPQEATTMPAAYPFPLFRAGPFPVSEGRHYAVTSDGQKFLVQVGRPDQSRTLHVVSNWPQILHAGR